MYRFFIAIFSLLLIPMCYASGRTKTVKTEYVYHIPGNVTPDQAREIALERARQQVIADEFGTFVSQSNTMKIDNINGKTNTEFRSEGGSELKGEWVRDIEQPKFTLGGDGTNMYLKVIIHGEIREIAGCKVDYDARFVREGNMSEEITNQFMSGDTLYMSFKSPASGYLAIYLLDEDRNAFCLLPYQNQKEGIFPIKANKKYILFDAFNRWTRSKSFKDAIHGVPQDLIESYSLTTDKQKESNKLVVIFSPNKFYKGNDNLTQDYVPRAMSKIEFQNWLSSIKKKDGDLAIDEKDIFITSEEKNARFIR